MNRKEFMEQLEKLLMDIPQEERIEALAYYNGYFEDAGVENEANIIKELESPEKVARIIKADVGAEDKKEYSEKGYEDTRFHQQEEVGNHKAAASSQENRTLKIILLVIVAILTSPVWLGILGGIAGVVVGIVSTIIGILVALTVTVLSCYLVSVVFLSVAVGMLISGAIGTGIGLAGAALILLALAILGTVACVWLYGKFMPWMIKGIINFCSGIVQRRRTAA